MKTLPKTMKSAASFEYGDYRAIKIVERNLPKINDESFLVEVKASAITTADSMMRRGIPKFARLFMGLTKPKKTYLGTGFSGVIVKIGKNIQDLKVGDEVFGETGLDFGANSQYAQISHQGVYEHKPSFLSHEQACCLCDGALTSYSFLCEWSQTSEGKNILINGGSGSLGLVAIQLAKIGGAHVSATCSSINFDRLKNLGADKVFDYRSLPEHSEQYDIIFDCVGKLQYHDAKRLLVNGGSYLTPVLKLTALYEMLKTALGWSQYSYHFAAIGLEKPHRLRARIKELLLLIEQGQLKISVDQVFSFNNFQASHQQIEDSRKNGNFVLVNSSAA